MIPAVDSLPLLTNWRRPLFVATCISRPAGFVRAFGDVRRADLYLSSVELAWQSVTSYSDDYATDVDSKVRELIRSGGTGVEYFVDQLLVLLGHGVAAMRRQPPARSLDYASQTAIDIWDEVGERVGEPYARPGTPKALNVLGERERNAQAACIELAAGAPVSEGAVTLVSHLADAPNDFDEISSRLASKEHWTIHRH
jgi:hypothetical protein